MKFLAIALCLVAVLASANGQIKRPPPPKKNPPPPPFVAPRCNFLVGGATSISNNASTTSPAFSTLGYAVQMMTLFNETANITFSGRYYAVGSGGGITGFTNKAAPVYCVGFSDDPMTDAQETAFNTAYPPTSAGASFKLTIPAVLAGYGFFANPGSKTTRKTQTLRFTGADLYKIYFGGGSNKNVTYQWKSTVFDSAKDGKVVSNTTDSAFVNSIIRPYSRSDSSGTTALIKSFFKYALCGPPGSIPDCPTSVASTLPAQLTTISSAAFTGTGWYTGFFTASGTTALCTAVNSVLGSVGYSQRAICNQRPQLVEIAIKNKAGVYVTSLDAGSTGITTAAPLVATAYDKPWTTVTLLYSNGAATPPIVSYVYAFIRKRYPASQIAIVKKFGLFITSSASALVKAQEAELLVAIAPSKLVDENTAIKNNVLSY